MKFALRVAGANGSLQGLASAAREWGYDGLELSFLEDNSFDWRSLALPIACLSVPEPINLKMQQSERIRTIVDRARAIDCGLVRVQEASIAVGKNRGALALSLGDWLLPLADYAAEHDVMLALDLTASLRSARETWALLDRVNHPSLCCCLDARISAQMGESPQVSVPMLNSRIGYVQVSDVKDRSDPTSECDIGEGVLPIEIMIARLRGIGYAGWMAISLAGGSEMDRERASRAIQALSRWSKPPERAKSKPKAVKSV